MIRNVDLLIHARWVIPIEPDAIYDHYCIAIDQGRIVDLLPSANAASQFQARETINLTDHALIPGLINAHTHAAMTLLRGLGNDLALMDWLTQHVWPAESAWINQQFVQDGTELAMAEMLRGGTTCFNDMYFFPDQAAQAAERCGMRACVGLIMLDFPTAWARDPDEYLTKGLEVHDFYQNHPLISTAFAPHAPYTVSDAPLEKIRVLADELDIPIQMHIHETADEIKQNLDKYQQRPLSRLHKLGLLSQRLQAVHMTQLTEEEICLYAAHGGHVLHCPESNLKLASGFCPVAKLIDAGINVALGTDGAASNNDLDMFGEMRIAALLAKAVANDPTRVPAKLALRMATLNGARAMGLDGEIGSLAPGKMADITAVNLGDIEAQPVYDPVSHLVYSTGRDKVTHVWVAGRQLLKDRELTTLDSNAIIAKARNWRDKIANRVG